MAYIIPGECQVCEQNGMLCGECWACERCHDGKDCEEENDEQG